MSEIHIYIYEHASILDEDESSLSEVFSKHGSVFLLPFSLPLELCVRDIFRAEQGGMRYTL